MPTAPARPEGKVFRVSSAKPVEVDGLVVGVQQPKGHKPRHEHCDDYVEQGPPREALRCQAVQDLQQHGTHCYTHLLSYQPCREGMLIVIIQGLCVIQLRLYSLKGIFAVQSRGSFCLARAC